MKPSPDQPNQATCSSDGGTGKLNRRIFLKAALAAAALHGCTKGMEAPDHVLSEAQRAGRHQGRSTVAIVPAASYEEDLFKLLQRFAGPLALPNLTDKKVVIKPNLVEYRPGFPITTHPAVLKAAVQLADSLGAREIVVAEGPGHFRDTEYILNATGIKAMCDRLAVKFVDLNLDDLEKVPLVDGLTKLPHFYLPRTIVNADFIISLPKLKMHHWVGLTASMKNLFGVVPGRKYGWPKNLLHWVGINASIMDLVRLVRPGIGLVDGIVAMEGDGPVNGTARESKVMILGTDVAAVDATSARIVGVDPEALAYLRMARQLVGNTDSEQITLLGSPLEEVAQSFELPVTYQTTASIHDVERQGS